MADADKRVETFWRSFLKDAQLPPDTRYLDCYHFELTEQFANELLALVLAGKKRATAGSLASFAADRLPLPKAGDYNIVTDWDGNPRCVIQTTQVTVLPFCEMTFEICSREGEDDDLASWQAGHRRYFARESAELGYTFTEDMPVVFEDFTLVYQK